MTGTTVVDAAGLSARLSSGEITAYELTLELLRRIDADNPRDHVFIATNPDAALRAARASDERRARGAGLGPLDGMPVAVKDNIDTAGMATSCGFRSAFAGLAEQDAGAVAGLRSHGAIILGKLNLHEGALGATTDNPFWGRCANPTVEGCTPGGSSGGSGAAVAAGLVHLALGTDTMGSVRIPAAYCGVWGLKPTRGLIATSGLHFLSWTLDTIGPLAKSAYDLAICLDAMAGAGQAGGTAPSGWSAGLDTGLVAQHTRLGVVDPAQLANCEAVVLDAYDTLLDRLRDKGVQLVNVTVAGWQPGKARRAGLLVSEAECGSLIGDLMDRHPDRFSQGFRDLIAYGRNAPAERLAKAYWQFRQLASAAHDALRGIDALLLPTAPQHAFPHGSPAPANQADFTALANIAGLPAVAFPYASSSASTPASAQLVGHPFREGQLLTIAHNIA